jgi:hypothetical protein
MQAVTMSGSHTIRHPASPEARATVHGLRETPGPRKPQRLDRVRETVRARHYSRRAEKAYVAWARRCIIYHGKRHPIEMGGPEVTKFLSSLAVEGNVAASTPNQALSALLFRYRDVLGQELPWLDEVVRPKRTIRCPWCSPARRCAPSSVGFEEPPGSWGSCCTQPDYACSKPLVCG